MFLPEIQKGDGKCTRLDAIPALDGQDGQTDRQTEMVKQYRALYAVPADVQ